MREGDLGNPLPNSQLWLLPSCPKPLLSCCWDCRVCGGEGDSEVWMNQLSSFQHRSRGRVSWPGLGGVPGVPWRSRCELMAGHLSRPLGFAGWLHHNLGYILLFQLVNFYFFLIHVCMCACTHMCLGARSQPQMLSLRSCLPYFKICFISLFCECAHVHITAHYDRGQRIALRSWLSSVPLLDPGI